MNIRNTFIGLLALTASTVVVAGRKDVVLNPQHPDRYRVVAGDTLWDVASKFLQDPWQWPELWDAGNKERPLRPGDVLTLTQAGGKPRLQLNGSADGAAARRPGDPLPVVKLSPKVRVTAMAEEIPVIPMNVVRPFLSSPKVVSESVLDDAPYVVETTDRRRFTGAGHKVYVRGMEDYSTQSAYGVFHKGVEYLDGETGEGLGFEAVHVGDASLVQEGDPAIFTLAQTQREARIGDRLLPLDDERIPSRYEPHAPQFDLKGHVVGVMGDQHIGGRGGVTSIGQYAVVVVDRGANDGLEVGHVLDIYHKGRTVNDKVSGKAYDSAALPDEVAGSLLVFRVFERASFGLIMKATRDLRAGDVVQSPQ